MTDKQIINEIDISKCEFCEDSEYCYIYSGTADFKWLCRENEDCQIKNLLLQLARKNQELEELQETIDDFITDNNSLYSDDGKQPSNLDELQECMQSSMNEFVKYKQALDEIEKLAKENVELLEGYHLEQANCLTILEIINQAKDGE